MKNDVILAWIDTGIKVNGNEPLMISLLKRSDYFSGYYVGTPSYLVNGMCRKTLYSGKKTSIKFIEILSSIQGRTCGAYL